MARAKKVTQRLRDRTRVARKPSWSDAFDTCMRKLELGHAYDFRPISSFKGRDVERRIYEGGVIAAEVLSRIVRSGFLDLVAELHVFEVIEEVEEKEAVPFEEGIRFEEFRKECSFKYVFLPAFYPSPSGGAHHKASFIGTVPRNNPVALAFYQGLGGDAPPVFAGPKFFTTIDKYFIDGRDEFSKRFCVSFVNNQYYYDRIRPSVPRERARR